MGAAVRHRRCKIGVLKRQCSPTSERDMVRDEPRSFRKGRLYQWGILIGVASAGAALLFQGLLHLAVPAAPFAPFAVGELALRYTSGSLATWAIDLLGHQALHPDTPARPISVDSDGPHTPPVEECHSAPPRLSRQKRRHRTDRPLQCSVSPCQSAGAASDPDWQAGQSIWCLPHQRAASLHPQLSGTP